ncbi:MAG: ATP-binding protein [Pseudomonadota bacterium]
MTDLVDIIIHVDENIDHDHRQSLADKVREMTGIVVARLDDAKPHLMIVEYDPDAVKSIDILECVKSDGVHAELVGL